MSRSRQRCLLPVVGRVTGDLSSSSFPFPFSYLVYLAWILRGHRPSRKSFSLGVGTRCSERDKSSFVRCKLHVKARPSKAAESGLLGYQLPVKSVYCTSPEHLMSTQPAKRKHLEKHSRFGNLEGRGWCLSQSTRNKP